MAGDNRRYRVLAYGDSNTWGAIPAPQRGAGGRRFDEDTRWTRIMLAALGPQFTLFEEGLNGRTTCLDDPVEGRDKNGATYLPVSLLTHKPLDLVIIMLGTNDLKYRLSMTAGDIADGAANLAAVVGLSDCGPDGKAPEVLLVCPAPLGKLTWLADMLEGAPAKAARLPAEFRRVAAQRNLRVFDAGSVIRCSDVDGIHLDQDSHLALGRALAAEVGKILQAG